MHTDKLTKSYKGVEALKALDLDVERNSIFGFLGPNGAGKTTTIKLLLGLVRPTSGSATVFGHDIVGDSIDVRRRIGYLAQDPRYYEHMTARETLTFTARFFYRGPRDAIEKRVSETLEIVGLADKADRPIKGFSGGERQRLGIGQAQVNEPDLLILDEPAASLDPMGRRDVLAIMERLRERSTVFYSTHILDDVQRVSDTVAILDHGELIAQAPIEELLAGTGGVVYSLGLKGDGTGSQEHISSLPWVSEIRTSVSGAITNWQVTVTDEAVAERELLRAVLADESVTVTAFGRKQYELEEIFMDLVEGNGNGS
ncbi:multidrug ABC transporter ATP-binding protein [candidate division BRC1 bacterium SM23_51]|nr:MAG: multidrug ABC transporter ATP-binding protein [candidate division BRC1 bacterium SM23_51]